MFKHFIEHLYLYIHHSKQENNHTFTATGKSIVPKILFPSFRKKTGWYEFS